MATIDIRTIKVLLDTNIPGKEIVPLTKSVLYQPKMNTGKWNEYPFFTMDAEYPEGYLSRFTYEEQMEFFFNKRKMTDILRIKSNITERPNNVDLKTQNQFTKDAQSSSNKSLEIETTKLEKEQNMKLIDENEKKEIVSLTSSKESRLRVLESSTMSKLLGSSIKYKQDPSDKKTKFYIDKGGVLDLENGPITTFDKFTVDYKNFFLEPMKKSLNDIITQKTITELFRLKPGKSCDNDDTEHIFEKPFTEIYETLKEYLDILDDIQGIKHFENIQNRDSIIDRFNDDMNEIIVNGEQSSADPKEVNKTICDWKDKLTDIFSEHKTELKQLLDGVEKTVQTTLKEHDQNKIKINIEFGVEINKVKTKYQNERLMLDNMKTASQPKSNEPKKMSRLEYETERNRIGEKNLMIMIRLMFPTKYPLVGNIFSSFHSVVTGKNEFNLKWTDFIPSFFKKQVFEGLKDYSYLKIDGAVYTVTQAIWLNDIYNHKEYKQLVYKFEELQRWKDKEIARSNIELTKRYKLFQQTYRTGTYELNRGDIEIVNKTLDINTPEEGRSSITADRLNKYKTMVNGVIKALEQFLLAIQSEAINKHAMLDNATKFVELMTELRDGQDYRAWFRLENQERFDRIRRKMKEDLDNIKADQYILDMYLKRPGINMDYEKDTKHKPIIDQKYSTYTRFVDNIRKFRAPVLESSNMALQNTIEDFLNNTEKVKNVFIFLMNPINVKKNPFSELVSKTTGKESDDLREEAMNYQNRLNTGITIRPSAQEGQPYYEVYIQVNVIGGEVNDDNKSAVDCMYQGESLGDKLARLLNEALYLPWTMNNSRIFFDITTGEAKSVIDKQEKEKKEKEEKEKAKEATTAAAVPEKKMGGNKTRRFREWLMKTQKRQPSLFY
jgi:hypothetical protein